MVEFDGVVELVLAFGVFEAELAFAVVALVPVGVILLAADLAHLLLVALVIGLEAVLFVECPDGVRWILRER